MTTPRPVLHFVGFRGDEYVSARRVWGRPDYFHLGWDLRAQREIAAGDVVVFAKGDAGQRPAQRSFPDIIERVPTAMTADSIEQHTMPGDSNATFETRCLSHEGG